jgi:hypothetical protein
MDHNSRKREPGSFYPGWFVVEYTYGPRRPGMKVEYYPLIELSAENEASMIVRKLRSETGVNIRLARSGRP